MDSQQTTLQPAGLLTTVGTFTGIVFGWMTAGLMITAVVAFLVANSVGVLEFLFEFPLALIGLFLVELVLVVVISSMTQRISAAVAGVLFVVYSIINGIFLSTIFLAYSLGSIGVVFAITAGTFGLMSIYGITTGRDLTRLGNLAIMGLVGILLGSVINIFLRSDALTWLFTYVGIGVFLVLTARDAQQVRRYAEMAEHTQGGLARYAIVAALALYLDFVNLFLMLLRLFGDRR